MVKRFTIDMDGYLGLDRRGTNLKARFDQWLRDEDLIDKRIVFLEMVDEGVVDCECYLNPSSIELTHRRFTVHTPPPSDIFRWLTST